MSFCTLPCMILALSLKSSLSFSQTSAHVPGPTKTQAVCHQRILGSVVPAEYDELLFTRV